MSISESELVRNIFFACSTPFPTKRLMRSPATAGQVISGNCRTLWSRPPCYPPVYRCECPWLKFLTTPSSVHLAGEVCWSKPSESRFCERFARAIGLSEVLVARQLAWASRGRPWPTRCRSWGFLALPSKSARNLFRSTAYSPPEARPPIFIQRNRRYG